MSLISVVDLSERLDSEELRQVFLSSDYPAELASTHAGKTIARYRAHPAWKLYGAEVDEKLVGAIGIEQTAPNEAEVRNIAVLAEFRHRGVGTALVRTAWGNLGLHLLCAETDHGAVNFYRQLGFAIESLGEKYPGVERFWCTLEDLANPFHR